jgi:predicted AlkP superfamily pyrophosphatase or phosphodiesterase
MMRRFLWAVFLVTIPGPSMLAGDTKPPVEHLVLISVDGFNPVWYQDAAWPAPFLQSKAREGASARRVRPPFPSQTRPGHVTMITGWLPARHGVFHNGTPYRFEDGASLWHAVSAAGGTNASVVWPGSPRAPIDFIVRNVDFPEFSVEAADLPGDRSIESSDTKEGGHSANYERYIRGIFRDARMMAMGVGLIESHRPTLTTLRFNETDSMQHVFGRDGAAVRGVVASMDLGIAEVAAAVERAGIADRTIFIVTGDHGMENIRTLIRPNALLSEAGLGGRDSIRFDAYGGAALLYGASEAEANEILAMLEKLPEEVRHGFSILSRERLDELGADPGAVFALTARSGFAFDTRRQGEAIETVNQGRHGHLAGNDAPGVYTGFVAWGPGIEPGRVLDEIGLEDIAPTAADMLGIHLGPRDGQSLLPRLRPE